MYVFHIGFPKTQPVIRLVVAAVNTINVKIIRHKNEKRKRELVCLLFFLSSRKILWCALDFSLKL